MIYSHSHADHFGGVRGVVNGDDVAAGKVKVIAPAGFMEEAVGENVIAGNAMSRRALYQFGPLLPRGEKGQVDAGLGKTISIGTVTLIPPTQLIEKAVETHRIDGVDIVFELTPGAEAPSEMIMYYPQFRVLEHGRDHEPEHAQPAADPRRAGARCAGVVQVHRRARCTATARRARC